MKRMMCWSALALLPLAAACAPAAAPDGAGTPRPVTVPLEGTHWRLVEIQSMDDAQGTVRPDDPNRYRLTLDVAGRAVMQLDCNRGMGSWSFTPSGEGNSGAFGFGPVASTKMYCPQPSLGDRLGQQFAHVRSYVLKDGRLYLSLMADGGIQVWERTEAPSP